MTLLATTSIAAISLYAMLATVYKSAQVFHARRTTISTTPAKDIETNPVPSVDVIVPCFNEDPIVLSECLASLAEQDYAGKLRIYVVDDGSKNRDAVVAQRAAYADDERFNFTILPKNVGKRKAQIAAITQSSGDLILNVDSDTTIAPDVVSKLAHKMRDPAVGAAMGQMKASNQADTWLTRLIDMEYWLACNEERAAQARFGAVMCCCGPCAMYRRSAMLSLLDQYETQLYRGKPSDFGEDRHLTILMLSAGFRTEYVPSAIAATVVPDTMGVYLRQQLRWARSTFRDTLLALPVLPGLDRYLTLDAIGQNVGLLLLALSVLTGIGQFALTATLPWWTILVIGSMTLVRCSVAAYRARELRFLGFALHTLVNIFLLIPLKAYALCTLSNSDWLSRGSVAIAPTVGQQGATKMPGRATSEIAYSGE
ncbi:MULTISPECIES: chitooligosaccharide synthase NodC [Rhizobium]|uniref:N-acetylglucosaminyltransferase n=63 Tax=Rhizobium TaxID=379 RepID=Q1M7W7_RHIJ3|nr:MULTISPECIES: chitooligosaccharide synthase NodC [Rhizobium]MBY5754171.1 chitooligosaccharide synthase NodC [Rhizobium leguminosarum]MBY5788233.1 chitooligosaccharide synthase NodC [Rhizobium leguminosarum]NEH39669.1 chitooligosaccharide synthase NodC [Rhizobium ruizarguesonis]NEI58909.1 chitooligosaccharide synthase NodC [Rhizobium leguminosarum]NEI89087.1 chitooligosaccharide synthase NodC [Rhizobium leguminosarum]